MGTKCMKQTKNKTKENKKKTHGRQARPRNKPAFTVRQQSTYLQQRKTEVDAGWLRVP